jgi:hypothetical protein
MLEYLILVVVLLCVFFLVMFPHISLGLAKYLAYKIAPMPGGVHEISSYNVGNHKGVSCYMGEAYLMAGSNLDVKDVQELYVEYFPQKNWNVEVTQGSPDSDYRFFLAVSKQKTFDGIAIEGITINKCSEDCLSRYEFSEDAINEAKKYRNILVLETWFIPYEVRQNVCWCCSGG